MELLQRTGPAWPDEARAGCERCSQASELYEYECERHNRTAADLREAKSALRAVYALMSDRERDSTVLLEMIEEAACTGLEDWEREAAVREYREEA